MEYHGLSGQVLTAAEKAAIQVSFVLLAKDTKGKIKFWGRVSGVECDYLLCQKETEDIFTNETFYSVNGGLSWMLLPPTSETQAEYCKQLRGVLIGNPQYEYKIEELVPDIPIAEDKIEAADHTPKEDEAKDDDEAEEEEQEEEDKPEDEEAAEEDAPAEEEAVEEEAPKKVDKKPKKQIVSIQETTRLAFFVEQVDFNCSCVPRGAYLLNESDMVVPNKFFEGLSDHDAGKLSSYCHTRPMQNAQKGTDCFDFMDTLDQDVPRGVWTLKFEPILGLVVGANLLYPGLTFYHKPSSNTYGQYYFGDGQQNFDLPFML